MSTRVWVPATIRLLAAWFGAREVPAGRGHAVTAELRGAWPDAGEEEWEYSVLLAAADDAAGMLDEPGRRVVLVLETDDVAEREGTTVVYARPVPWRRVAAVLADAPDAGVSPCASAGDEADLGWYGAQEVPDLLGRSGERGPG